MTATLPAKELIAIKKSHFSDDVVPLFYNQVIAFAFKFKLTKLLFDVILSDSVFIIILFLTCPFGLHEISTCRDPYQLA